MKSVLPAEAGTRWRPATGRDIKSRDEQEMDARRFVESRKNSYVHTYEEPDTSAWKRRRVRQPDGTVAYRVIRLVFEGALEDLKRGKTPDDQPLDGLIVYDIDRLTRDNRHLEDAIEVVENFRRPITGTLDLLTDNGRTVARLLVAVANKSSADTARRVCRKHHAMQQAGIPAGSTRPFGHNADKRTLDPEETAAIYDTGIQRLANRYPTSTLGLSQVIDNRMFGARILGNHAQAIQLARAAIKGAKGRATSRAMANYSTMEARALANRGDPTGAGRAMNEAERHFEHAVTANDPAWLGYFDSAEPMSEFCHWLRGLKMRRESAEAAQRARDRLPDRIHAANPIVAAFNDQVRDALARLYDDA
ncbi:recombinase family protein [Streptomyces sp. NPDC004324]